MIKRSLLVFGVAALMVTTTLISSYCELPVLNDARELAEDKKYDQAIEKVQTAMVTATPEQCKDCRLTLGLLYYKAGRYDNSLNEFKAIVAQDEKNVMAWFYMGYIYEQLGMRESGASPIKEKTRLALDCWKKVAAYANDTSTVQSIYRKLDPKELIQRANKHIKLLSEGLSEGINDDK
jgi:tetratricopeptide (TPR) repeat protein